jgi:glycosyltransferase involved in cell wall biosynthesis
VAQEQPITVELAGYLSAAVGVGEAARRYVGALRAAGAEVIERDVPLPGRDNAGATRPREGPASARADFRVLCLNPEQMIPFLEGSLQSDTAAPTTVAVWSWEVDVLPASWPEATRHVDEIWTYSTFAATLLSAGLNGPVHAMPLPVAAPTPTGRLGLELPSRFRFLMMFDFLSTLERKNPIGGIMAYRRAFTPDDGTALVVKSINGGHRPAQHAEVMKAIEGRSDIVLIDETLPEPERDALIAVCDCLLSLHRSEGYGLTLAEAMAIGKPVVATSHGGNMEFMNESNSFLVPCTRTRVGNGVEHYPAGATWAEPDVAQAAQMLRIVRDDPEERSRRAERSRLDIKERLAFDVVGEQMVTRLKSLGASRRGPLRGRLLKPITTIRHALR